MTLSTTGNDRITQGGNNPPEQTPFDIVVDEITNLFNEAKNWADGEPIASQDIADAVEKVRDALHAAGQRAEALRVEEVRPLDEAKAAIQTRYHPLIGDTKAGKGMVVMGKASLGQLLTAWRLSEKERLEKIAAAERAAAEAVREEANRLMRESSGNLEARQDAEHMLSSANLAAKDARKAEKQATTGLGLRTSYHPEIEDVAAAIRFYWKAKPERFAALVLEMAAEDFRAGRRSIPGIRAVEQERAL